MKASRYNILIPGNQGNSLLFNCASAALAEIESENLEAVKRLLADPDTPRTKTEEEFYQILCDGHFLLPGETDELAALTVRNRRQRFGGRTLFLTIAPTLACNFRCDYCFEHQQASAMAPETESALIKFADQRSIHADKLLITWFGGEPTLCMDTVERLQRQLHGIAAKHGLDVLPSSMVTNGYLLNRKLALQLKELGITDVQVTLDGPLNIHDRRRKLAGGGGTFDRIISNLKEVVSLVQVTVRVNVDRDNAEAAFDLAQQLERWEIVPPANLYFAPVNETSGSCTDLCDRCFTTEEFSLIQTNLYDRLMSSPKSASRVEYPMLAPGGHCGADAENAFVVAPSGDLFKCWEEVALDRGHSIGSVHFDSLSPQQETNLNTYLSWNPLQLSECRECGVLPICMGGCPRQGLKLSNNSHGACSSWKYNLEPMLRLHHQSTTIKEVTR